MASWSNSTAPRGNWTDERIELLKHCWDILGLSASQCAGRLGGVTRNAVIAKVHRLGLSGRASKRFNRVKAPKAPAARRIMKRTRFTSHQTGAVASIFQKAAPVAVIEDIPPHLRVPLAKLDESKQCRWPVGDPQHADFGYCGGAKVPGLSYCEHHVRRAYQPPQPRRQAPGPQQLHQEPVPTFASSLVD